jgi:hypothetical protein
VNMKAILKQIIIVNTHLPFSSVQSETSMHYTATGRLPIGTCETLNRCGTPFWCEAHKHRRDCASQMHLNFTNLAIVDAYQTSHFCAFLAMFSRDSACSN